MTGTHKELAQLKKLCLEIASKYSHGMHDILVNANKLYQWLISEMDLY